MIKEEIWWFWDGLKALSRVLLGIFMVAGIIILLIGMML